MYESGERGEPSSPESSERCMRMMGDIVDKRGRGREIG